MRIKLDYGKEGLWVNLPNNADITVIKPKFISGLLDEKESIRKALRNPVGTKPLRVKVSSTNKVSIVFSDITRPVPNHKLLITLLGEISHVPTKNITLINALGTHRKNTKKELIEMLGKEIVDKYNIVQHDAFNKKKLVYLGKTSFGHEIWINKLYMSSDVKILTGLIEPHFFAGFSGGPKSVLPGLAGEVSILQNHDSKMIDNKNSTWGITFDNPIWEEIKEVAKKTEPSFLLNVTINKNKEITGIFTGDIWKAYKKGTSFDRETTMVPVSSLFDIVITTNSGYPLDINLYQSVKGMSVAAQIVKNGGSIIIATECKNGVPDYGNYRNILKMAKSPRELLDVINKPDFLMQDQWEAQIQAEIQIKADVYVKTSYISDQQIREALLIPCHSIEETVNKLLLDYGRDAKICVLPEGPQTIPYFKSL